MISHEVNRLRKEGKLTEALKMISELTKADKENIWNKRAFAWVFYDLIKHLNHPTSFNAIRKVLKHINKIKLPPEDKVFFDRMAFQVGRIVFKMARSSSTDPAHINAVYDESKKFHFTKPSEAYSFLLKAFLQTAGKWDRFMEFADWWDFSNFRDEDFQTERLPDGRIIRPLAERAHEAYSLKLNKGLEESTKEEDLQKIKIKIKDYLPQLQDVVDNHPEFRSLMYHKVSFQLELKKKKEEILESFLPFARGNTDEMMMWLLMADIYKKEEDKHIACLCRALLCEWTDEMRADVHEKMAGALINKKMYSEARYEIDKCRELNEKNEWEHSENICKWTESEWYKETTPVESNETLCQKYLPLTDEILYGDIPQDLAVVEFVNHHKKMAYFVVNKELYGFFKFKGLADSLEVGDVVSIRLRKPGQNGLYKVYTLEPSAEEPDLSVMRDFKGKLSIHDNLSFGQVNNIHVSPSQIAENKLTDGDPVKGRTMISFNKKKDEWFWKAISIHKSEISK